MSDKDSLEERVDQYTRLELPGQPQSSHVGTSYLVRDLWTEVKRLREVEKQYIEIMKHDRTQVRKVKNRGRRQ